LQGTTVIRAEYTLPLGYGPALPERGVVKGRVKYRLYADTKHNYSAQRAKTYIGCRP